jgi:predicted CoA-binding protein
MLTRGAMTVEQQSGRIAATTGEIDDILVNARCIAVVGLSKDPGKVSHRIAGYLQEAGYRIIPVNPTVADRILGERAYPRLADIPGPVDLVDVFRPPVVAMEIVRETVARGIPAIWFQLDCASDEAVTEAVAGGLVVVRDRCIMVEHRRYAGFGSR